MISNLDKDIGLRSKKILESNKTSEIGELFHHHWINKKKRSKGMSNSKIDEWYDYALKNGAIGGKVVGAGGGGFLMFYSENPNKLRNSMNKIGLQEVRFRFDFEGTKTIIS